MSGNRIYSDLALKNFQGEDPQTPRAYDARRASRSRISITDPPINYFCIRACIIQADYLYDICISYLYLYHNSALYMHVSDRAHELIDLVIHWSKYISWIPFLTTCTLSHMLACIGYTGALNFLLYFNHLIIVSSVKLAAKI